MQRHSFAYKPRAPATPFNSLLRGEERDARCSAVGWSCSCYAFLVSAKPLRARTPFHLANVPAYKAPLELHYTYIINNERGTAYSLYLPLSVRRRRSGLRCPCRLGYFFFSVCCLGAFSYSLSSTVRTYTVVFSRDRSTSKCEGSRPARLFVTRCNDNERIADSARSILMSARQFDFDFNF